MLFLAVLLGQAGYTLAYAGGTGRYWQDPWAYVKLALGQTVPTNLPDPSQADEFASALLGFEAFKLAGSALSSVLPAAGGGGGGGDSGADDEDAEAGSSASALSKFKQLIKDFVSGKGGDSDVPDVGGG